MAANPWQNQGGLILGLQAEEHNAGGRWQWRISHSVGRPAHSGMRTMADSLPTEAPYTLRDILDFLNHRVQLAHAVMRSSEIMQPRYSTTPGYPPISQFLVDRYAVSRLLPAPVRMDLETAIALKLFHRLEKASKKWYHSDLNPEKFAMIVVRVLEGSGRTLDQMWGMPVESFEGWWIERIKMQRGKRIGLPGDFPLSVLEWLTSKYLSHPTPDSILHPAFADKFVVLELLETFTAFLQANDFLIAPTLEALSTAYLIADMRFDLYGDGPSTEGLPLVSSVARLKLLPGSYRMLAISVDVIEASKTQHSVKSAKAAPNKPKGRSGKPPLIKSNPLLVNLYDSVLVEWREGRPSNEIIEALQTKKDVLDLAKLQNQEINAQLIRNAKKYRKENPSD